MFRRNPDAFALAVIALCLMGINAPRFFEPHVRMAVTPLKYELQANRDQVRAEIQATRDQVRSELAAHRDEIRQALQESIRCRR